MYKKRCRKCQDEKECGEFSKDKQKSDGLDSYCKQCRNNKVNQNYHKNPAKKKESNKKWRDNNLDKFKTQCKKYRDKEETKQRYKEWLENNPEKVKQSRQKIKEYLKKKRVEEGGYWNYKKNCFVPIKPKMTKEQKKILYSLRDRLYSTIKKEYKKQSAKELLGCTLEECKLHIESQFYPEMNWENWGKIWEIDHIKPCSSFNLIELEEQQKCFHHTNLRPLFITTAIAESFGYKNIIGNRNKSAN